MYEQTPVVMQPANLPDRNYRLVTVGTQRRATRATRGGAAVWRRHRPTHSESHDGFAQSRISTVSSSLPSASGAPSLFCGG